MDALEPGEVTPDGKETRPIIYNVGNLSRPTADAPALMTIDNVETSKASSPTASPTATA